MNEQSDMNENYNDDVEPDHKVVSNDNDALILPAPTTIP